VLDADTGERFWGVGGQDAFGNVTRQDYGNGVYGEYGYDALSGRAVHKQWSRLVNGLPQIIDSVDYGYDVLANVNAQRRNAPSIVTATESCSYDKLQRRVLEFFDFGEIRRNALRLLRPTVCRTRRAQHVQRIAPELGCVCP
jgi:hypothetical protein